MGDLDPIRRAVQQLSRLPGVGEKTAMKFVQAYGSMEGLYENLDDLKGKMCTRVHNLC